MQIIDTFVDMLQVLEDLRYIVQGLVIVIFLQLIMQIAIAKNTQTAKRLQAPRGPRVWTRLYRRLRKKQVLPPGDKKEGVEK